jgi:hypothetical protein
MNEENSNNNQSDVSYYLDFSKKLSILMSLLIIVVGLSSNLLTIMVFSQKKYRKNSGNVYLLTLAILDNLFLIIHFFEVIILECLIAIMEIYFNF